MKTELIRELLEDAEDIVFLDSIRAGGEDHRSFLFSELEKILTVRSPEDVAGFFEGIEHALSRGMFVAGWLSYELGYVLQRPLGRLLEMRMPDIPLAWMGVFKRRESIDASSAGLVLQAGKEPAGSEDIRLQLGISRKNFINKIRKIHEHIRRGETYQVNFTIRGTFEYRKDPLDLYRALREKQGVNYAGFIRAGGAEILCLSPELFFRKDGERIWSRPMKGTIRRGRDRKEDALLSDFLARDEKNRAENVMIVDLIRNDLGIICETGTVEVPELFTIERYETLFQMISRIEGRVRQPFSWGKCFSALFPCGSVTGAPKIKTMELIADLEDSPRGVYTGAIGFITPGHDACFNVAIRTITLKSGRGELGIGSGVTIYSEPEKEFSETLLKAAFLSNDIQHE